MKAARRLGLALALLLGALSSAQAVERILLFISDVRVQHNGDLQVTETIRVQAEGREIRRGILRDFPTTYRRTDGTLVVVDFEVQSVTRDGRSENYALENLANGVRIRIGRADRLLSDGPHDYVISYRTSRQIGFFQNFDELYWNATGTGWTFAIDRAEARITLPERVSFTQRAFYTGPQGARGKDAEVIDEQPGRIVFRTTRPLPPRNGLTVAAAWAKGVVDPPSQAQLASWWLRDNLALMIGGLGLILVLGYYLFAWLRVGRDPARGVVVPLFGPPDGMSAAAVRYVSQMSFDDKTFTAAIIDLGVRGHLTLKETGDTMRLNQRKGGQAIAAPEQAAMTQLFKSGPDLELEQSNHAPLGKAKDALKAGLAAAYSGKLFNANAWWAGGGLALWFLASLIVVVTVFSTFGQEPGLGMLFGSAIAIPGMITGALTLRAWRRGTPGIWGKIIGALFAIGLVAAGVWVMALFARVLVEVLPATIPALLAPLIAVGFSWLKAPSVAGRKIMDQIEGFRHYLGVAEEDRLEFLNPPKKTAELFERFLPYAVALDVENAWAKRFAGVLAAASAEEIAAASSWYSGSRDRSDPVSFASHLGGELSQTIASASTPPGTSGGSSSSSGSSGGGSSGGGGGGGGGSGW